MANERTANNELYRDVPFCMLIAIELDDGVRVQRRRHGNCRVGSDDEGSYLVFDDPDKRVHLRLYFSQADGGVLGKDLLDAALQARIRRLKGALSDVLYEIEKMARNSFQVSPDTFYDDWICEDPEGYATWKKARAVVKDQID